MQFSRLDDTFDPEPFIHDPTFCAQEKKDGRRCLLTLKDGVLTDTSRNGIVREPSRQCYEAAAASGLLTFVIDGELMDDGSFFAFDALEIGGRDVDDYAEIVRFASIPCGFACVAMAETAAEKAKLVESVRAAGGEGVVFKRIDAPRGIDGGFRYKFRPSETYRVTRSELGELSIELATRDGVPVGKCGIDPDRRPAAGSLVEIAHDGMTKNGKLKRPSFLRVRDDLE